MFSGDVLIVEKPYATVLYPHYYSSHCMQCFTRITDQSRQSCTSCQEVILLTLFSFPFQPDTKTHTERHTQCLQFTSNISFSDLNAKILHESKRDSNAKNE